MNEMVPLYGFGGGGGTGAALTVTAPAGCTVTVSKDGKTKTKIAGADGVAVFKGLATGEWSAVMTDGAQISVPKTVMVTTDYEVALSFFMATINITYPAGSLCTATDGATTLTAPDTSGVWECVVPNAGTWMISGDTCESVTISDHGQTVDVEVGWLFSVLKSVNRGKWATSIASTGTFSVNNDRIYLSNSSNSGLNPVCVVNDIPIKGNGKTVYVSANAYNAMTVASFVGLTNDPNSLDVNDFVSYTNMGSGWLGIQIPNDGGLYYFKAILFRADSPNYTATVTITEIKIE